MRTLVAALALCGGLFAQSGVKGQDPVLRAMIDELDRSKQLRVVGLDTPYYIEYSLEDQETYRAKASLGSLLSSQRSRARIPQIQVRTGDYDYDNSNHVYSGQYSGARYDPQQWPLDNNYAVLRQCFWLATDRAYKAALEGLARKRAALEKAQGTAALPDFYKEQPVRLIQNGREPDFDEAAWNARAAQLSGVFNAYPELQDSSVSVQAIRATAYFANSEGSVERAPDNMAEIHAQASTQAADGMQLHDSAMLGAPGLGSMAADLDVRRAFTAVAENVRSLTKAPVGENYSGPVLFEGTAAAQLMAQLVGDNLRVSRRPVSDPGRPAPYNASEFETKLNSRVLPEWIDVVDDATQREWQGTPLLGYYPFDLEGVPPQPVMAVQKGVLKSFLTTRQPVRGMSGSNGHARLDAPFGVRGAAIGNLFIKASQTKPAAELKAQLIETIKQQNRPYGILIRKLDYPSSASMREMQAMFASMAQSGGVRHSVSPPVLVYRVYPDGREELVRGLRFKGLGVRALRDILAASQESTTFDFINNGAPFAMIGAGGYLAPSTVVSPALLFEEIELEPAQDELSHPPLVPPPPIDGR